MGIFRKSLDQRFRKKLSFLLLGLLIFLSGMAVSAVFFTQKTTTSFPLAPPTSLSSYPVGEDPQKLLLHQLDFDLDGSLIFAKTIVINGNPETLQLVIWGNNQRHFFNYDFNEEKKIWENRSHRYSPKEFLSPNGKSTTLRHQGDTLEYQPDSDSFQSIWAKEKAQQAYHQECTPVNKEEEICFEYRSVYESQLKNRAYPWDGRFAYRDYSNQPEEEVLTFDYADLNIIWDDPENYCQDDCFSTQLVGFFDNYSKALLVLNSESTSRWGGEDDSSWFGFYLADLKKKTLQPFKNTDLGSGKRAQFHPSLVFPDLNSFVYFKDEKQLIVQNLNTGKKRVLKTYQEKPGSQWLVDDFRKVREKFLFIKGSWVPSLESFEEYFDLAKFEELSPSETPVYVHNWQGYWNQAQTQYAWEEEGKVYVYDSHLKKIETLLWRNITRFSDYFRLAGWGY